MPEPGTCLPSGSEMEKLMAERSTPEIPAETDDARSADATEANEHRKKLAEEAQKGLHKAVKSVTQDADP
jgi:hypothetical protein